MEQATTAAKKRNIFDSFQDGARKGWNIFVKNVLPSIIMAYTFIYILETTGLMEVFSNIFSPVMGIFGLPPISIVCLATVFFSRAGGSALAASFVVDGSLTPMQATILLPTMFLIGGTINQWVRVISVCGTRSDRQKYIILMTWVLAFLSLWITSIIFPLFA
jgi:spore maturation protein SpmB